MVNLDVIFGLALSFLSVLGAVEIFRKISFWAQSDVKDPVYITVMLDNVETAESTLRGVLSRIRWMEFSQTVHLVLVHDEENKDIKKIIDKIILKYPQIKLSSK